MAIIRPISLFRTLVLNSQHAIGMKPKLSLEELLSVKNNFDVCMNSIDGNNKLDLKKFERRVGVINSTTIQMALKNYDVKQNPGMEYVRHQKTNDSLILKKYDELQKTLKDAIPSSLNAGKLAFSLNVETPEPSNIAHLTNEFNGLDMTSRMNKKMLECSVVALNKHANFQIASYEEFSQTHAKWATGSGLLRSIVTALQGISNFRQGPANKTESAQLQSHGKVAHLINETQIPLSNGNFIAFSQLATPITSKNHLDLFLTQAPSENEQKATVDAINACLARMNELRLAMEPPADTSTGEGTSTLVRPLILDKQDKTLLAKPAIPAPRQGKAALTLSLREVPEGVYFRPLGEESLYQTHISPLNSDNDQKNKAS